MNSNAKFIITGCGMISAVGHCAAQSCASARAGISRQQPLSVLSGPAHGCWAEDYEPSGHCVPSAGHGFVGKAKVLELGRYALDDLLVNVELSAAELERTGIYVNLSSRIHQDDCFRREEADLREIEDKWASETTDEDSKEDEADSAVGGVEIPQSILPSSAWKIEAQSYLHDLLDRSKVAVSSPEQRTYFGDHTGLVQAIRDAVASINSGVIDRCIIGAVDSMIEPKVLCAAAECGVSRSGDDSSGFIPGEAAAFFLLESQGSPRRAAVQISGLAQSTETFDRFSDVSPQGIALAEAFCNALGHSTDAMAQVGLIISDISGDPFHSIDWGSAIVRIKSRLQMPEIPIWYPATSFGETGAAAGAVSIVMAVKGYDRSYIPPKDSVICLSSDSGERAAIVLQNCTQKAA